MIEDRQKEVIESFSHCTSWEERYNKLIQMGKTLPPMEDSLKTEENLVQGCQSKVWLQASVDDKKNVIFRADGDALIVKGLVALLVKVYSNSTPDEIMNTPPSFIKALGFEGNLSPSRSNGLFAMIKQIKIYATAFKILEKRGN
ncbi:MAG TPA: SufE family protein [Pseudobdellovibrionaceae bacterium]|nr:SufE family protein [Pseudobdellovibrionaceae bacterium]